MRSVFCFLICATISCTHTRDVSILEKERPLPDCLNTALDTITNTEGCLNIGRSSVMNRVTKCLYSIRPMKADQCIPLLGIPENLDTIPRITEREWPYPKPDTVIVFRYCIQGVSQFTGYSLLFDRSNGELFSIRTEPSLY